MTDNYKPFSLDRALAGDKFIFITHEKKINEIEEFYYFEKATANVAPFICRLGEDLCSFRKNGSSFSSTFLDGKLVMLPKKKKLWIAVRKTPYPVGGYHGCSNAYEDEKTIEEFYQNSDDRIFMQIEIEE